jgi:hypothetical protein
VSRIGSSTLGSVTLISAIIGMHYLLQNDLANIFTVLEREFTMHTKYTVLGKLPYKSCPHITKIHGA